jgi:hypothetical protein
MKKNYYFKTFVIFCIVFFCVFNSWAQDGAGCLPPTNSTRIAANNIDAFLKTNGSLFFNENQGFVVPKNSGISTFGAAGLWLGALNFNGNPMLSAPPYFQIQNHFFTGPMNSSSVTAAKYDRFWSVSREEIEYHKLHYANPSYTMPESISNWPAIAVNDAGETVYLAPYKDVSGNGKYTPSLGDYPEIRGDYAAYFIMNDRCGGGDGTQQHFFLGAEILCMVYAYDSPDPALQNTLFLSYVIRNKSMSDYYNFYFGLWNHFTIGDPTDDYLGCDTLLNLAYGYNSQPIDGHGGIGTYGTHPPAQGAMFLNQEMEVFLVHDNKNTPTGYPATYIHYYQFLNAFWRDNSRMVHWGNGHNPTSTDYAKYMFSGDPVAKIGWTEFTPYGEGSVPNSPGGKYGLMSAGPYDLRIGESLCIDIAFPFARDYEGDHLSSVTLLKQRAREIQQFYDQQNFENNCSNSVDIKENTISNNKLLIYPNPSNGQFIITGEKIIESIELYDMMGKKVFADTPKTQTTQINLNLSQGLYIYRAVLQDQTTQSGKIVVQN